MYYLPLCLLLSFLHVVSVNTVSCCPDVFEGWSWSGVCHPVIAFFGPPSLLNLLTHSNKSETWLLGLLHGGIFIRLGAFFIQLKHMWLLGICALGKHAPLEIFIGCHLHLMSTVEKVILSFHLSFVWTTLCYQCYSLYLFYKRCVFTASGLIQLTVTGKRQNWHMIMRYYYNMITFLNVRLAK